GTGRRGDRATLGSPYRRRKPPASHPQLAGPALLPPEVATARDRFPRARWRISRQAGAPGLSARSGVPPAARERGPVPGGDMVAPVAPQAAVITARPPIAAWCVAVRGTGGRCLPRPAVTMGPRATLGSLWGRDPVLPQWASGGPSSSPAGPCTAPGEARAAASPPP